MIELLALRAPQPVATELVADTRAAVAAEPLRERRWGQLMRAVSSNGRRAEGLRAFQRACGSLAEVGLEPGRALIDLERTIAIAGDGSAVTATPSQDAGTARR